MTFKNIYFFKKLLFYDSIDNIGEWNNEFNYNDLLTVDLLIIDDLGTESSNNMKFSELFNILNTRLLNQNNHITKTIISTNLSLNHLFKTYDERIFSRLVGYYNICRFIIRIIVFPNCTYNSF